MSSPFREKKLQQKLFESDGFFRFYQRKPLPFSKEQWSNYLSVNLGWDNIKSQVHFVKKNYNSSLLGLMDF